jgi:methylated-DNA-[protein]-cysteine S-methyltransferase
MNAHEYTNVATPLGRILLLAHDGALRGAWFDEQRYFPAVNAPWDRRDDSPLLRDAIRQLNEYFAGERRSFDLPLAPIGTAFQRAVWCAIAHVGYGATISYAKLAANTGRPQAIRAAGAATGRNPLSILIPCHRIVGTDGTLTGYAGGLPRKGALLALEGQGHDLFARAA